MKNGRWPKIKGPELGEGYSGRKFKGIRYLFWILEKLWQLPCLSTILFEIEVVFLVIILENSKNSKTLSKSLLGSNFSPCNLPNLQIPNSALLFSRFLFSFNPGRISKMHTNLFWIFRTRKRDLVRVVPYCPKTSRKELPRWAQKHHLDQNRWNTERFRTYNKIYRNVRNLDMIGKEKNTFLFSYSNFYFNGINFRAGLFSQSFTVLCICNFRRGFISLFLWISIDHGLCLF